MSGFVRVLRVYGMASLLLLHQDGSRRGEVDHVELTHGHVAMIGRDPQSSVAFAPDVDRMVSRRHAQIVFDDGNAPRWRIADLDSFHGVFVNGVRVEGEAELAVGDEVRLGLHGPCLKVTSAN